MERINRPLTALGLMSGTSMDGVDAALVVTDGIDVFKFGKYLNRPYDLEMRNDLKSITGKNAQQDEQKVAEIEQKLTMFHVNVVQEIMELSGLSASDIDIIGFHGQTIYHSAEEHICTQIGNGDLLAKETGIDVINRFRNTDIANGGNGAPIMPSFYQSLARDVEKPFGIINIGGISTITWLGENGELVAYDAGPGNALIDDWVMKKHGMNMDFEGNLAAVGTPDEKIIAAILRRPWFQKAPPKTADRNQFSKRFMENLDGLNVYDGAATLTCFTAVSIAEACKFLPRQPKRWVVCGGGAHNPTMMRFLKQRLESPVISSSELGWNGDYIEAQGLGYLAARSLFNLPISFPTTTGVEQPICGGMLHKAKK